MDDDIDRRLAAAATAIREHDLAGQRLQELSVRIGAARAAVSALRERLDAEQADVERLEGLTLSRVLAAVRGDRDEAADASARVDRALAALRTELADLPGPALDPTTRGLDQLTRFTDIWMDNLLTDFVVLRRVERSLDETGRSQGAVAALRRALELGAAELGARLAAVEAERGELLKRA